MTSAAAGETSSTGQVPSSSVTRALVTRAWLSCVSTRSASTAPRRRSSRSCPSSTARVANARLICSSAASSSSSSISSMRAVFRPLRRWRSTVPSVTTRALSASKYDVHRSSASPYSGAVARQVSVPPLRVLERGRLVDREDPRVAPGARHPVDDVLVRRVRVRSEPADAQRRQAAFREMLDARHG